MIGNRYLTVSCVILIAAVAMAACADEGGRQSMNEQAVSGTDRHGDPTRLLFIHHSCGGQLLSDPGKKVGGASGSGERCIYESHPNGGGLRTKLTAAGYEVHEASYESKVGADTDIEHWRMKFSTMMDRILVTDRQDDTYADGRTNSIVVFKSCYPNNDFVGPGAEPGDPDSSERTVANAKAAYRALLPIFAQHPEVLFMAVTAPPRAEPKKSAKEKLGSIFKKKPQPADWAREFNTWMADTESGWLGGYQPANVAVFDYYDVLTKHGETNWSAYPTGGGRDSHPTRGGNEKAAHAFVPSLNAAVEAWRREHQ